MIKTAYSYLILANILYMRNLLITVSVHSLTSSPCESSAETVNKLLLALSVPLVKWR
jgi:hypothetical protein